MIYFDNAATTMPKPETVYQAVDRTMRTCASLGRSGHPAAQRASAAAYACREAAGRFFSAEPEQVVFTTSATHGLNIAIKTLVKPGDRVVISGFEHNAVLRPLYALGAEIVIAGRKLFNPADTLAAFAAAMTPETKAVVCTHVSNVFGYILPVADVAKLCRDRGVPLIVDAAQSAGVLPVSLRDLGAAFIAMPGHKGLYGPQGTGLLLCGQMPKPLMEGGTGSQSELWSMPTFLPDAAEAGTHNVPGIAGLLEGIRYVEGRGLRSIARRESGLIRRLAAQLKDVPELQVFEGPEAVQSGVLSITAAGRDCETMAQSLGAAELAVRAGLHCAPVAHESAGTLHSGTVRLSVSDFNTPEEVDAAADILRRINTP